MPSTATVLPHCTDCEKNPLSTTSIQPGAARHTSGMHACHQICQLVGTWASTGCSGHDRLIVLVSYRGLGGGG